MRQIVDSLKETGATRRPIKITACAVWDTVSSLGLPVLPTRRLDFVNSDLCGNIEYAFQALSLHEHRRDFRPVVWNGRRDQHNQKGTAGSGTKLKQCWFLGYHGHVGGGGEEEQDVFSHFTLVWMMAQLADLIRFDASKLGDPDLVKPEDTRRNWQLPGNNIKHGNKGMSLQLMTSRKS
jgi:hypothetical protein